MDVIPVLVVDEGPALTQALLLALRRRTGFQILGPVPDADAAIEAAAETHSRVIVVQLDRGDGSGVDVISAIRDRSVVRVLAATSRATPAIELALAAGACGVLPTELTPSSLADAFRRALAGELVLPVDELPLVSDQLRDARLRRVQHDRLAALTLREREVLAAVANGRPTVAIALQLGISPATVETHVKNILTKLGVHSKVEALGAAWRGGLVSARSA
jgi:two-component system nitrate/nitrite response regulator NarL